MNWTDTQRWKELLAKHGEAIQAVENACETVKARLKESKDTAEAIVTFARHDHMKQLQLEAENERIKIELAEMTSRFDALKLAAAQPIMRPTARLTAPPGPVQDSSLEID